MANDLAVKNEQFVQQCATTKLKEFLVHGGVQLALLNFQSFNGGFQKLILAVSCLAERINLTWTKHDEFLHLLQVGRSLRQNLVQQRGKLVDICRLIHVFLGQELSENLQNLLPL